jgi:hypothetical protein
MSHHTRSDGSMRSSRRRAIAAITALSTLAALVPAGSAQAADTAAPVVTIIKRPAFVKGTTLTTSEYSGDPESPAWYSSIDGSISWSATDAGGICGYSLYRQPAGDEPSPIFENRMVTKYTVPLGEYDGTFGGGSVLTASYFVTATDCAGNVSAPASVSARMQAIQDDGSTSLFPNGTITYTGAWSVSSCTCWSALTTRKATAKNASAAFTTTFAAGQYVGLVMATGPDRGKFDVYVDGKRITTVNTYAAAKGNRKVVWVRKMGAGTHTITIVNLATAGRPRIDLDAVILS